jgi:hypothetical protein
MRLELHDGTEARVAAAVHAGFVGAYSPYDGFVPYLSLLSAYCTTGILVRLFI